MSEEIVMEMFTVYDHPRDLPNYWVVRRCRIMRGELAPVQDEDPCFIAETHEEVQKWAEAQSLYNIGRMMGDDPTIAEVWL